MGDGGIDCMARGLPSQNRGSPDLEQVPGIHPLGEDLDSEAGGSMRPGLTTIYQLITGIFYVSMSVYNTGSLPSLEWTP